MLGSREGNNYYYCITEFTGGRREDRIEQATVFSAKDRYNTPVRLRAKSE